MGRIYLGAIVVLFVVAFVVQNVKTYVSTGQEIRGKSRKLTASLMLSTLIYAVIGLRLILNNPGWFLEVGMLRNELARFTGFSLVTTGFVIGLWALISMQNSWRVGIRYDQKTTLVTTGIYKISRNPYFLSYDILMLGFVLLFPSPLLFIPYVLLVADFHLMIKEEEKYLESQHGSSYLNYKSKVGRYLSIHL